jgi:hypothetical protein
MMALNAFFLAALLLVAFPHATLGCRCMQVDFNTSLHALDGNYVRGRVIKDITPTKEIAPLVQPILANGTEIVGHAMVFDTQDKMYIFQVSKVFKGCAVTAPTRILVTSGAHSCGTRLAVNKEYVIDFFDVQALDSIMVTALGNRTNINQRVDISACGYNRIWDRVPKAHKAMLLQYKNSCL